MAIKIYEKFAPRANPADGDYPYGSIKNESVPGAKDGTPIDAVWANDYAGFDAALFAEAGIVPSGQPDTVSASQRVDAMREMFSNRGSVADIAAGKFKVGVTVEVIDRAFGAFNVQAGGSPNGIDILDAGNGNTAVISDLLGIKSARTFGAKLDWNGISGTDDSAIFSRMHELGVKYALDGLFAKVSVTLPIKDKQQIYAFGGGIYKENAGYLFSTMSSPIFDATVWGGTYTGNDLASFAEMKGSGIGYNNSAKLIKFVGCNTAEMEQSFSLYNARACRVDGGRFSSRIGYTYEAKSAECVINDAIFVKSETTPLVGSIGLGSSSVSGDYPEGLTVTNTLFFRFERNFDILDAYIAKFSKCYFDSGTLDLLPNRVQSLVKTEGIDFDNCWFFGRSVEWGNNGAAAPIQFRSSMNQTHFSAMLPGADVIFKQWTHGVTCTNQHHDSSQTGTHIGYVAQGQNNGIILGQLNFEGYNSYAQFVGDGKNNSISDVPNRDGLSEPITLQYPVNVSNVEGYCTYTNQDIVSGSFAANAVIAEIDNVLLTSGIAFLNIEFTSISIPSDGFLVLQAFSAGTLLPTSEIEIIGSIALIPYSSNDKSIRMSLPIRAVKATKVRIRVINEASSPTITGGAFSNSICIAQ